MKIRKILWRGGKDFTARFYCEHCGYETVEGGVVNYYFMKKTLPSMICEKCGKQGEDLKDVS